MVVERSKVVEKPYGWVIFPTTIENFGAGDLMKMPIGLGGILVRKSDGKKIQFGSAFSLEENLKIYELGYLDHYNWDIIITKVRNDDKTVDIIYKIGVSYVIPEYERGAEWRIPKSYSKKQIKKMIKMLPLRLNIGAIYFNYQYFDSLKHQKYIKYKLKPNEGYENSI